MTSRLPPDDAVPHVNPPTTDVPLAERNDVTAVNQPRHRVALPSIGLLVGEIFDLDTLAEDCSTDGRYEFFFSASPLPVIGSVDGPINPVVVK